MKYTVVERIDLARLWAKVFVLLRVAAAHCRRFGQFNGGQNILVRSAISRQTEDV
jgi:hypothetical protein